MTYAEEYASWQADPEAWWMRAAEAIDWTRAPSRAQQGPDDDPRWFADALVNTCYNAVDRHVAAGNGAQAALIHDSAITGKVRTITFAELQDLTARFAGALTTRGVTAGDRVVIYMPMVAEAVIAMLACTRIGAIHSVVFGGFSSAELAVRLDDAEPKAIIAASCGLEPGRNVPYKPMVDGAIEASRHAPEFCVILQREQHRADMVPGRDLDWDEFQQGAQPADCVPLQGDHPAYILYTSGTTGAPKGVVRPTAGHLVGLNWTMKNVYGVDPGEVFWAASDVGWVVGHSYICYAPLIHGNTSVMFEGKPVGTPDAGTFWRVVSQHEVRSFFTAPTAFRAVKREDPDGELIGKYDLSCLRTILLAGERADPDTIHWTEQKLGKPVIDHWWQTETGYSIAANPVGLEKLPVKVGSAGVAMPGYDVRILGEDGHEVPRGTLGAIAITLPLPPGNLPTLWNAHDRFRRAYLERFPGYYETGDAGLMDDDGYIFVMSRTDDVINVAGHRLSTGAMEEVLADHPDVAECAVIGVADDVKGAVPMGLVCLTRGVDRPGDEIARECAEMVRERIGPVAAFRLCCVVDRLPKTRSGKVLRRTMSAIAAGEEYKVPATIDDPAILEEITVSMRQIGYPR